MATLVRCDREGCGNEDVLERGKEADGSKTILTVTAESKGWTGRAAETHLCQSCRDELAELYFGGNGLVSQRDIPLEPPREELQQIGDDTKEEEGATEHGA